MPIGAVLRERLQPLMNSNRMLIYAAVSIFAIAATTLNAMRTYNNFYSVAIHLSRSGRSLLVLANFGIFLAFASGRILQKVFFGPLLPAEVERLYDRTWFFITESLLAFTIFRDDFDVQFGIMFGFLLFVKCFHWLLADRVEWMDQRPYPGPTPLFHIRALSLFALLGMTDAIMLAFTVESTLRYGVGATVLFSNEYAILFASLLNAVAKYTLSIVELRRASRRGGANAPPWEAKSTYIFYVELLTDFCKLTTYLTFFVVIITFYGLPLNIIRDVYMTGHSFITRLTAFYRYRTATRDMDQRYPNATAEELSDESDKTCIICREEMVAAGVDATAPNPADGPNMTPKKLPCGHIFHFHCLRSWLERQQNCPTCRRTVLETGAAAGAAGARPAANGLPPVGGPAQGAAGANAGADAQGAIARAMNRFFGPPPPRRANGLRVPPPLGPNGEIPFQPHLARAPAAGNAAAPTAAPGPQTQHPPALVFEYNYVWDPNTHAPVLGQPPMLQGFYREDGLWQPWPGGAEQPPVTPRSTTTTAPGPIPSISVPTEDAPDPALLSVPRPNPRGTAAPTRSSPLSRSASTSELDTVPVEPPAATGTSNSPPSPSNTATPVSRPMTPRDAAALAAMRRFGGPPSVPSTQASNSLTQSPLPAPAVPGPTAPETPSAPSASTSSATESSASTPVPTKTVPASGGGTELPAMIPLYDFGRPLPSQARSLLSRDPFSALLGGPLRTPGGLGMSAPPGSALWSVPERVTDEQLARLDTLTREAIDERLRILEDVSGAAHRCAEQLLRVRSVLPAAAAATPQPSAPPAAPDAGEKGKGVDPSERGGSTSQQGLAAIAPVTNAETSEGNANGGNANSIQPVAPQGEDNLAASVASQLAALTALTTSGPTAPQAEVQPGAVPLAVMDPALEERVGEGVHEPSTRPSVGGQELSWHGGSDTDESESEDEDT